VVCLPDAYLIPVFYGTVYEMLDLIGVLLWVLLLFG
jgi:hypothetical protein